MLTENRQVTMKAFHFYLSIQSAYQYRYSGPSTLFAMGVWIRGQKIKDDRIPKQFLIDSESYTEGRHQAKRLGKCRRRSFILLESNAQ